MVVITVAYMIQINYNYVYYPTYVEYWNDEGGTVHLVDTKINATGLPIHYHNFNDIWGKSHEHSDHLLFCTPRQHEKAPGCHRGSNRRRSDRCDSR